MSTNGNTNPKSYLSLVLSVLAAIGTVIATAAQFGLAGAFLWGAVILLIVAFVSSSPDWVRAARIRVLSLSRWLVRTQEEASCFSLACILAGTGGAIWFAGLGEARLWRAKFTDHHKSLMLDEVDFGINRFAEPNSDQLGTQQSREREEMIPWIQWMVRGANEVRNVLPAPGSENISVSSKQISLIYASSVDFDGRYSTTHLSLSLSHRLKILDAVAFLISGTTEKPWWKGTWRQMSAIPRRSGKALDIIAAEPNEGERLVVFVQVEPEGKELPPADQLVPVPLFEVRR